MPPQLLGPFIRRSSRISIIEGLEKIKTDYIPNQRLITKTNCLGGDAIHAIDLHLNVNKKFKIPVNDAKTYIAASALSHLLDGWGYLANSIQSLFSGDKGVSVHLAYYAELRSVMSFLASEGVGVFSNKHIGIKENSELDFFLKFKKKGANQKFLGTHIFAWDALEKWCQSSVKPSTDILKIFKVEGFDFLQISEGFYPTATPLVTSQIAKKWLLDWAFDIKKFRNDRTSRNFVSYRPQSISNFTNVNDFKQSIEKIYSFLQVLSPQGQDSFNLLDKYLLRDLFNELYVKLNLAGVNTKSNLIDNAFTNLGVAIGRPLKDLLLGNAPYNNNHSIFTDSKQEQINAFAIIARAALLLRISTGLLTLLLKEANIQKNDLAFVWNNYGFNSGFWETMLPINDFYELWVDIDDEYTKITSSWGGINNNPYSITTNMNGNLNIISQINRAALWGI